MNDWVKAEFKLQNWVIENIFEKFKNFSVEDE